MGYRYGPGRMALGFGPGLTPTIKALLAANITMHVVQLLLRSPARMALLDTLGLVPALALPKLHLWQFVTYMFLHGGFWHLAFNMFALWMFGSDIEALWGRRTFLQYYFVSGLGGGLTYTLTAWGSTTPLVGASGAIFGILLAYGLLFPDRQILLYFLIPIKARWFVLLFGGLELLAAWQGSLDNVGHFAHLGGMLFGYVYLKAGLQHGAVRPPWRRRAKARIRIVPGGAPPGSDRGPDAQAEVDAILEKISQHGLQSLTEHEKDVLRGASRRH